MWTHNEEIELLKSIRNKAPLQNFATKYNKNIPSIELRLGKIIYENVNENKKDIHDIAKALQIPEDEVNKKYKLYENSITHNDKNHQENNNIHIPNVEEIEKKIEKLERENKFINLILENNDLHHKLNDAINNNKINKNIKTIIKELRKKN
jgi:hypothetical protein